MATNTENQQKQIQLGFGKFGVVSLLDLHIKSLKLLLACQPVTDMGRQTVRHGEAGRQKRKWNELELKKWIEHQNG